MAWPREGVPSALAGVHAAAGTSGSGRPGSCLLGTVAPMKKQELRLCEEIIWTFLLDDCLWGTECG